MPSLKILFAASECTPFAKTGGLADVVAGLSKTLRARGHDARIVLPLYGDIDLNRYDIKFVASMGVHMGNGEELWAGVHETVLDGEVPVWLIAYDRFYARPGIYDDPHGEYPDNAYRFAFFSKAILQLCKDQAFIPDVIHAHDWPTALVPLYLKTWDRILSPLSQTASVLTIHNVGYQGVYHDSVLPFIGVGGEHITSDTLEDHGKVNLLKGGIAYADAITTVSPTHAREIVEPAGGRGLAPYLSNRYADLSGILNGVDYEHWNPASDKLIPANFAVDDLSGKAVCKSKLQQRFGLEPNATLPVFGIVSRFAEQKGFDLLREALPQALRDMVMQVVVLGTGDRGTEEFFHRLTHEYPGRVGSYIGFSNELSHLIEAGSDFFLMPSHYEPCGLNQCYSMRYGTLPLVRATGGLDDTVRNYHEGEGKGTGFKFWDATGAALYYTIGWAVATWFDRPHHIASMRREAMVQDFSWDDSAGQYLSVYERAIVQRRAG